MKMWGGWVKCWRMKRKISLIVAALCLLGYAELCFYRMNANLKELHSIESELSEIRCELNGIYGRLGYTDVSCPGVEEAVKGLSKNSWSVYGETADMRRLDDISDKLEALVDELRQLNGTLSDLTH